MPRQTVEQSDHVLLYDVPREAYEALVNACPERRFRHTYLDGQLEMQSVLHEVQREDYEAILAAFGDRRFRHTYLDGELEVMSPSEKHEWIAAFIGRLVDLLSYEFDIPIKSVGATTRRHAHLERGLEPDRSYYVANEPQVRGLSSDRDDVPPPDLAIEVDITHRPVNRLKVYATLGVPEVWRYRDDKICFLHLEGSEYREISHSLAFPILTPADIENSLHRLEVDDENTILRGFIEQLRSR